MESWYIIIILINIKGLTVLVTRVITRQVKRRVMEFIIGTKDLNTMDIGRTIR